MIYVNTERIISITEWDNVLNNLNIKDQLCCAKTIAIKPNFAGGSYVDPKTHVISDLFLLRQIIELIYCVNPNAKIYIAESDSTGHGFAYLKFEHLGLPESLNLTNDILSQVELLDMTRDRLKQCVCSDNCWYTSIDRQLWISEKFMDADFKISLSNLKTHSVTGYTGACKNLFGCLPDFDKSANHTHINQVIHDIVLAVKPDLNIVDAFYGMEKNGPVQGIDVDSGYRVFSNNAVEADIYSAKSIGFPVNKIGYLKRLCKTLGIDTHFEVEVIRKFEKPTLFLRIMNRIGLGIQNMGQSLALFGHRIHSCITPVQLIITIARPILMRVFSYETLKKMKGKIMK